MLKTKLQSKSISEVALELQVSDLTVRNWVKIGFLSVSENGEIPQESIDSFFENVAGKQKLNARANKLLKDFHNHTEVSQKIQSTINRTKNPETLGNAYEVSLSDSYKNKEGIYYTPDFIVKDMMKDLDKNLSDKTFLDPCCGSGNFILEAIRLGFKPENVYGFDIDENAVKITKKRILEQTGYVSENIVTVDFLIQSFEVKKQFDCIFTNPPWGKKISKKEKQKYGNFFEAGKSLDTASLFLLASLRLLQKNGKLGFLLPDSFFNISVFEDVRQKVLAHQIDRLVDYKRPFKKLLTKAQAVVLTKVSPIKNHMVSGEFDGQINHRNQDSFTKNPKLILNFSTDQHEAVLINYIYQKPHITLKDNAVFGLGIVTGNNKIMCKSKPDKGLIPVYRGSDISKKGLQKATYFIEKDLKKYQQTAPEHLYQAPEKLIYKFISNQLCFYCDTQQKYVLNSANVLVLNPKFPVSGKELTQLLNSDFMTWLFRKIFATHKVLKSDLQQLPIHFEYFEKYGNFTERKYLEYLGIKKSGGTYVLKR